MSTPIFDALLAESSLETRVIVLLGVCEQADADAAWAEFNAAVA